MPTFHRDYFFCSRYSTYFFQLAVLDTSKSFDVGVVSQQLALQETCSRLLLTDTEREKSSSTGCSSSRRCFYSSASWMLCQEVQLNVQAACTVIYAFIYFLTIEAIAFVLIGKTSSPALRAKTTGLATATQGIFGIIMNFTLPYMINPNEGNMKGKVGFVFGGLALVASVGSYFYCPELKVRAFNEINRLFEAKVPRRRMGGYVFDDAAVEVLA
jgi:hypothetical protein